MEGTESERVRLTGKTKKGKQRVRMHGRVWIVIPNENKPGFLFIRSMDSKDFRWVSCANDQDFNVELNWEEDS